MKGSEQLPVVSRDVREILHELEKQEGERIGYYERFCHVSGKLFGRITSGFDMSEEMRKQISWAKLKVTPTEWWAGFLLTVIGPAFITGFSWLFLVLSGCGTRLSWYLPVFGLGLSALLGSVFYFYPTSKADIRKTEAQSRAIETVMLLSFALHHRPDLRGAALFAGNSSRGELSDDIRRGLLKHDQKHSYESVREMFTAIAHRWKDIDEGVRRAIFDVLRSMSQSEESLRRQDVAQAPQRVIENSERQLNAKLDSVIMPTMTFMVFGSLAIVGVIGLSPVFGVVGLNFIDLKFFSLASLALGASFLAFTVFTERRRPVTVPPPQINSQNSEILPRGKAGIFGRIFPAWIPAVFTFLMVATPGIAYVSNHFTSSIIISGPSTLWIVWGTAGAVSVYSYLRAGSRAKIRERVRSETKDWAMALNTIGSRVLDGLPMKRAMEETSGMMPETGVGRKLDQSTTTMEKFSVDVDVAIFETGVVDGIGNPLVVSLLEIVTRIKKASEESAGRACMMAADFLDTLQEVERRFKGKISDATGNLWLMAVVLLPTVCALSVWIMKFMSGISLEVRNAAGGAGLSNFALLTGSMEAAEIAILKLIMGLTVIALIVIVTRHIAVIKSGTDSVESWSKIPSAVLSGTFVFTVAFSGFGLLNVLG